MSEGCLHCYAETFAKRTGHAVWGKTSDRRRFGDKHWAEPEKWNRAAQTEGRRHRVFCASMADVFEDRPDHEEDRDRLWDLINETRWLDWQLLTKRPENVCAMVPDDWLGGIEEWSGWPDNVWIGCTVENQQRANERVPVLLDIPAHVRFLSMEPLLGPVTLAPWLDEGIGWVIVGGESGPKHRPLDLEDARVIRDECDEAGIPFFFKQVGGNTPTAGGDELDGRTHKQFPKGL